MTVLLVGGAYQGKVALAKRLYPGLPLQENLHQMVRQTLENGRDPMALLDTLWGKAITCDEIGCGVVPIDPAMEGWREATGRLLCALAAGADAVIRVTAGVPQFIKGETP